MDHRYCVLAIRRLATVCVIGLAAAAPDVRAQSAPGALADSSDQVSLKQAVERALTNHPLLRAQAHSQAAARHRIHQADERPNPELEVEVEEIGLTTDETGFDPAEVTVRVAQPFELGGKRQARVRMASVEAELAGLEAQTTSLDVIAAVHERFTALLVSQERQRLLRQAADLAETVRDTVSARVQSGKVPPLQLTKAEVVLAQRTIAWDRAEEQLRADRIGLASLWAATPAEAVDLLAEGSAYSLPQVPPLEKLQAALDSTPDLRRWDQEQRLAEAELSAERAARVPDLTVSAGLSHAREADGELAQMAFSLPLPIFDRNRGNIAAAKEGILRAQAAAAAARVERHGILARRWHDARAASRQAVAIRERLLPGAEEALNAAKEAYEAGKIGYLDVLDAQQTLFETQMDYLDAVSAVREAKAELDRLAGQLASEDHNNEG